MSFQTSLGILAGVFLLPLALLALFALSIVLPILLPVWAVVGLMLTLATFIGLLALYPISIIWAYRDAQARGKSGVALALLVALSPFFAFIAWPLSMLAWVVFRPEKQSSYRNIGPSSFAGAGHA